MDVLIIGCGIAGATTALELAKSKKRVTIITRSDIFDSNSTCAQGGIVSRGKHDSKESLSRDIFRAGRGLSDKKAVEILAVEGPKLVDRILVDELGIRFDADFGLEAAHSTKRILHVADATGKVVMEALLAALKSYKNVKWLTHHTAMDLVIEGGECQGVLVFDQKQKRVKKLLSGSTVLATGGVGQLFLYTTNPAGARGDGLAMAYRAGADIENTEYVQFHPTALALPGRMKFLISEALRGEGGRLKTPGGALFDDLAPRDVLSQQIYTEMLSNNYPYVLLDIASYRTPQFIRQRFPTIYRHCKSRGIDITRDSIPVVPVAHYFCGGVKVDLWGRTNIMGLYAVGEVTCTGLHGANRLASTSLLEGLVWGVRAALDITRQQTPRRVDGDVSFLQDSLRTADLAVIRRKMQRIRKLMWECVGLKQDRSLLEKGVIRLEDLRKDIEEIYRDSRLTDSLIGLRNSAESALVIARARLS